MKRTFILLCLTVMVWATQAQNPYFDLSYPWLYPGYAKENKIQRIVLGTMDSDGATQIRQLVIYFDANGNPIKEESRLGFMYTMSLHTQNDTKCVWLFKSDGQTDTITYVMDIANHSIDGYIAANGLEGKTLSRTKYQYDDIGRLTMIMDYDILSISAGDYNAIDWLPIDSVSFEYTDTKVKFGNSEYSHTMIFDDEGRIQLLQSENFSYGIKEETSYQWDINGMLLLIEWSQEGTSEKTFVTYTYYE
ncbi:MAG: hypothetical protein JXR53_10805 [Bacteroidales bacterium]|nr:hypothetical protein [Bacteroidales bacterium]